MGDHDVPLRRIPLGPRYILEQLFTNNRIMGFIGGQLCTLFVAVSGIVQGCPSSGLTWTTLSTPIIVAMARAVHMSKKILGAPTGLLAACADDLGAVLNEINHFRRVHKVFQKANKCTGLALRFDKCAITPPMAPPKRGGHRQGHRLD